jgi:large subunit ribosomal protein L23
VFAVDPEARKEEIKDAIEAIFKVKVRSVNTLVKPGKKKRQGLTSGRTPSIKKAVVTLAAGDKIEFFETK